MSIDKSAYKLLNGHVEYVAKANSDPKRALLDGIEICEIEKMPVDVILENIRITVLKNSKIDTLIAKYFAKFERDRRSSYKSVFELQH